MDFQVLSRYSRKQQVGFGLLLLGVIVFFFPFYWEDPLPGEIRYEKEDRLIARETGYLLQSPGEESRFFRKGENIFILDDPFLRFAWERLAHMLHFDRLLFEQQRSSRETLGDSLLTDRKIQSDLHAASELKRKLEAGRKKAAGEVLFLPALGSASPGFRIRSGMYLGKLCSGRKIVRAYADDRQIKNLKKGLDVQLYLRDQLAGISGKISAVYLIPTVLIDSPVLQSYGGEIPAALAREEEGRFRSLHAVYAVDILPDQPLPYQSGRFVRALVRQRKVLAAEIWTFFISALRREFS